MMEMGKNRHGRKKTIETRLDSQLKGSNATQRQGSHHLHGKTRVGGIAPFPSLDRTTARIDRLRDDDFEDDGRKKRQQQLFNSMRGSSKPGRRPQPFFDFILINLLRGLAVDISPDARPGLALASTPRLPRFERWIERSRRRRTRRRPRLLHATTQPQTTDSTQRAHNHNRRLRTNAGHTLRAEGTLCSLDTHTHPLATSEGTQQRLWRRGRLACGHQARTNESTAPYFGCSSAQTLLTQCD